MLIITIFRGMGIIAIKQ